MAVPQRRASSSGKVVIALIVLVVVVVIIASNHHGSTPPAASAASSTGLVAQISSQTGESNDVVQSAIDADAATCTESRRKLANETLNALHDLSNYSMTETATDFLSATRKAAAPIAPTNCAQIMAALLVLMEK